MHRRIAAFFVVLALPLTAQRPTVPPVRPLGAAVGNSLEIVEARDTVCGEGPPDFTELVLDACARLLSLSDLGLNVEEGRRAAEAVVADGSALDVYERWIRAQGGAPDPAALPQAPFVLPVNAPRAGSVTRLGAIESGWPRSTSARTPDKQDEIDHAVGVVVTSSAVPVEQGALLADVHAATRRAGRRQSRRSSASRARRRPASGALDPARRRA
jgi:pyrimidine-nucleoside phosphorylase